MNLAEKLTCLRKREGWSQEELAEKLNVSRQSVSKWESGQSTPEADKLLTLSRIWGVSVDRLLRDDLDLPGSETVTPTCRCVTAIDAERYLGLRRTAAPRMATATALCVLSPVVLILLAGLSETVGILSEGLAAGIGMLCLFCLVAAAVTVFMLCDARSKEFSFLEHEEFEAEQGVSASVRAEKARFAPTYTRCNIIATAICILAPVALILCACLGGSELACICATCGLLVAVAAAVWLFVSVGTVQGAMDRLLEEGDYRRSVKGRRSLKGVFGMAWWPLVTAVFLLLILTPLGDRVEGARSYAWVVFVIGGLLYTVGMAVLKIFEPKE